MLRTLFQWFDTHPESYWAILAVPSLLWISLAVATVRHPDRPKCSRWNELAFASLLLAMLAAWRWPYLLNANPYNPDESQFIAGAITLTRDPVFWRSVDATTSGPFNIYPLLPLHWLGAPLDYFSARLTGLLLVWVAILGCYRLVRSHYGVVAGRLAALPIAAFFAAATDADFVHYSSEHVPMALIAISACGLLDARSPANRRWSFLLGGFAAGMLPWAKLQTAPIAATLVTLGLWQLWADTAAARDAKRRLVLELLIVSAAPTLLVLTVVGVSGQIGHLYRDYLLQNFSYIDQNLSSASAFRKLWQFSSETGHLPLFAGAALATIVLAGAGAKSLKKKTFLAAGMLTFVAALCVIAPKRPSLHYTLLAVVPLAIWLGISLGELWQLRLQAPGRKFLAPAIALAATFAIGGLSVAQGAPYMFGHFSEHWRRPRAAAGNIVRALTNSRDCLAVWGWMDRVYVDTGLAQATHESETFEQIAPSRQRDHYRERYVTDLKKTRPAVFIDATGPGAPYFTDRANAGHESVPALAEFIRSEYRLFTDLGYARIYVRPERLASHPISDAELWRMITEARRDEDLRNPSSVAPKRLTRKKINGRNVQMMLPPAEAVWELDGTEREVFLEYGFDPKAYTQGHSNGAELIVELHTPGLSPRPIFNRVVDPARKPEDRGNLVSRIILPPFQPGTKFVVRTTPGEFGDNAWDWIYVGPLDRVRAPFFSLSQFPGFSRSPDSVESEYAYLVTDGEEKLLMLHAPTSLRFTLNGRERAWQFDYGFQPGAYTGEGNTDGARFSVELQRPGQPPATLFTRHLDPVRMAADQGRVHADVALPDIEAGDQLFMRIDPGFSVAWDWTYITHVQVQESSP